MSKQIGLIRLNGTLGGITFYQRGDGNFARMSGSLDKNRIANDPNFQRTRENNQEFGGVAKAVKAFRRAFAEAIQRMAGGNPQGKLFKVFKQVNNKGSGLRGRRSIRLGEHAELIREMELNNTAFASVFTAAIAHTHSAERNSAQLIITAINAGVLVSAPNSATHFRLVASLGLVPDFLFDDELKSYIATEA